MKKTLNTIVLLLALTVGTATATASKPLPPVTPADSTAVVAGDGSVLPTDSLPPDEVEAFSDTTAADTAADRFDPWDVVEDYPAASDYSFFENFDVDIDNLMGMFFVICILLTLFVLAPVAIIGLILYFVYKNRKQRLRLAEMAMSKGRAIPFDALDGVVSSYDALMNKGIKQVFLGLGLAILLWITLDELGLAIGALILLIGCGNLVIAFKERSKQQREQTYDRIFNGRSHQADHAAKSDAPNDVEIVGEQEN